MQQTYLGEEVKSLVEPDNHQQHKSDFKGIETRWAIQLQQVDHLHRIHQNVRTVMDLRIKTIQKTHKEDDQSIHIESTIRED